MAVYLCTECLEECKPTVVDEGIGSYEFWGAKGTHSAEYVVSQCCGADVAEIDEDQYPYSAIVPVFDGASTYWSHYLNYIQLTDLDVGHASDADLYEVCDL